MRIIIHDYEVFKYDTLFGAIIIDENGKQPFQTWSLEAIRHFYQTHQDDIWVGWNNMYYDDLITEAIVNGKDPYKKSKEIIGSKYRAKAKLKLYSYDLMNAMGVKACSLKLTELIAGKSIETTEVDFNLDRALTEEEKKSTEKYNMADLEQTEYNFTMFFDSFALRLDIIKEFNLDLMKFLNASGTQVAAAALGAKHDDSLKYQLKKPELYSTLRLKNQELIDFYLNERFREGEKIKVHVCDTDITIGAGGAHSAQPKFQAERIMYCDVSGYYNLIMIIYNLLSRTVPPAGKELYEYMYHQQLALKKKNPKKRKVYKTILLSVFGAQINEYTDLFDPVNGLLVTMTGQLFIVDLLEKLDGLVTLVQTNTDGIMLVPHDWNDKDKITDIIIEWETRTGFTIKKEERTKLWQRDVNCYFCLNGDELEFKGEAVKNYDISDSAYAGYDIFNCKEPAIIAKGIIDCLAYDISPEETVMKYQDDLRYYQYACKKGTYQYTTLDTLNVLTGIKTSKKLQGIDRAFACNSQTEVSMVYKHKDDVYKGHSQAKVANLPDNVFIYNGDLKEATDDIKSKIDWQYYVNRIYERIGEFIPFTV